VGWIPHRLFASRTDSQQARTIGPSKLTKAIGPYQTKRAAEGLAEKTLRPLNDGVLVAESTMTLNRFMETVYLPYAERQKRRSTFVGYRNLWKRYIKPEGDRALRELRTFECEQILTSIARTHDLCARRSVISDTSSAGHFVMPAGKVSSILRTPCGTWRFPKRALQVKHMRTRLGRSSDAGNSS
jgi:hypothetical protein